MRLESIYQPLQHDKFRNHSRREEEYHKHIQNNIQKEVLILNIANKHMRSSSLSSYI